MKFVDYEIIPSVVQDAKDPECLGRVKCVIPGKIHHDSTKKTEQMPWVRPFRMNGYQSFSKEIEGHKVWVLHNKQNYNEYWYFPIHEPINVVQDFLKEHYTDTPEVIMARNLGARKVMMRYDDKTGFVYEIGDDFININPGLSPGPTPNAGFSKPKIEMKSTDSRISLEGDSVAIGSWSDRKYEPAIKGDAWAKNRSDLAAAFQELALVCSKGSKTVIPKIIKLLNQTQDILATHTKIN